MNAASEPAPEESVVALARVALEVGQSALAAGDGATARQWLERAHRLVPADPNAALVLATAYLATDPARAAALFDTVLKDHDAREAWLGLAAARLRLIGPADAAKPLARVLSRYSITSEFVALAEAVAVAAGFAGWCGLTGRGELRVSSAVAVTILVDGDPLPNRKLPVDWRSSRKIDIVTGDGDHLLGSPIYVHAMLALSACLEARDGAIVGWAWHARDPDTNPKLELRDGTGRSVKFWVADDENIVVPDTGAMARPRAVHVPSEWLHGPGPFHVLGVDGRELTGSPLDPRVEQDERSTMAQLIGRMYDATASKQPTPSKPIAAAGPLQADVISPCRPFGMEVRRRNGTIIIPVHNGGSIVRDCLDTVFATTPSGVDVLVIDDGSEDTDTILLLNEVARSRRAKLLRHQAPQGFTASVNAGMRAAPRRDIVLLNSDTLLPPNWFERLRDAAYADSNIGTVTPLSNDGSIVSYLKTTNQQQDRVETALYDGFAARANQGRLIDIPVGVGFCMYVRRACLNVTGLFRADIFAQGYGEEVDFCLRAQALGWRHVAHTGVFVGHVGGKSFGGTGYHLRTRNGRIIERLHPGYQTLIDRFMAADPLAEARRAIDITRFATHATTHRHSVILITHDEGGGVEQRVIEAARMHGDDGLRPIILRPGTAANGTHTIHVEDGGHSAKGNNFGELVGTPNLTFNMPKEFNALLRLLRTTRPRILEVHHLVGYQPVIYQLLKRLKISYDVHVHDYGWFCPRLALVSGDRHYCGEPELDVCEACIADHGHFLNEEISVADLRGRSASFLTAANQVLVPSEDTGTRMRRHFPGLRTRIVPHSDDNVSIAAGQIARHSLQKPLVCVVGAIGVHKGYDILLACGRDAQKRGLDLGFIVVGFTIDDARLMASDRIFVTGRFASGEAVDLITEHKPSIGFIPSVCPETWCLALDDLWRGGLDVACFDIGAPAERIRRSGRGFVLPLGLSPSAINNALVAATRVSTH